MELNKIYNENCIDTMARMPDNFLDLTVTSPPYDNLREYKGYSFDFESIARELFRVTKQGGVVVWVVGDATVNGSETGTSFRQALYFKEIGFNLHDTMIYQKNGIPNAGNMYQQSFEYMFVFSKGKPKSVNHIKQKALHFNGSKISKHAMRDGDNLKNVEYVSNEYVIELNIWKYATGLHGTTSDKLAFSHPAIFPEKLAADHIYSWCNEGDIVYDPFMGSGTTAKMAHIYKRRWIGSEISKEYVDIAEKRLWQYLAQTSLF